MTDFLIGFGLSLISMVWLAYRVSKDKGVFLEGFALGVAFATAPDLAKIGMISGAFIAIIIIIVVGCIDINKDN